MVANDNQKVPKGWTEGMKGVIKKDQRGNQRVPK